MHGSSDDWNKMNPKFRARLLSELARLKAEVEEARKIYGEGMSVTLDLNNQLCAENARLQAEVERLIKVLGMCESIDNSIDVWIESKRNAAKEGETK